MGELELLSLDSNTYEWTALNCSLVGMSCLCATLVFSSYASDSIRNLFKSMHRLLELLGNDHCAELTIAFREQSTDLEQE